MNEEIKSTTPGFCAVPDFPGYWVRWSYDDDGLGSPQGIERFVQTDEGIAFAKPTYPLVQAWRYQIWYGPIKTIQKDDLQSVTADVESLRQAREEQQ